MSDTNRKEEPRLPGAHLENRVQAIDSIKTPLGFFALALLVTEGILSTLAYYSQGDQRTYLIIGMLTALILTIVIVGLYLFPDRQRLLIVVLTAFILGLGTIGPTVKSRIWLDLPIFSGDGVYIAAPMSSISTEEYKKLRVDVLQIISTIKNRLSLGDVYYAGEHIPDPTQKPRFDSSSIAWLKDVHQIRRCKWFVLIYPEHVVSSVLVEVGFAIALKKPVIIFVPQKDMLPYLLHELPPSANTSIFEYGDKGLEEVNRMIDQRGSNMFNDNHP